MASNRSKNIFATTYKDDFRDSDNYHRILFNSGRALQARELTQLQTIISREIERFGKNVFKDGASVDPISNVYVSKTDFVKLASGTLPAVGTELTGATSGVVAVVRETIAADGSDPDTILIDYINTSSATAGATPITFTLGETLNPGGLVVAGSNAFGKTLKGHTGEGVFFVQGHFVYAEAQETIISKYSDSITDDLGFKVVENIIGTNDTDALYDNQGAVPNLSAPGADRYQIKLTLTTRSKVSGTDNFVFTAKIVDGNVVEINNGRRDYNKVLDLLAERTYEESGNYTVTPFVASFEEDSADTHLTLVVEPGIGYVNGYRAEPIAQRLRVPKPTTTILLEDQVSAAAYGNYLLTKDLKGDFDTNNFEVVDLKNDSNYGGATIGTARVRAKTDAPNGQYRQYLFDVNMNSGEFFRNVVSFGTDSSNYANAVATVGETSLTDVVNNNLLFTLPYNRPSFTDTMQLDMKVHRRYTTTVNGSGEGLIAIADAGAGDGNFVDDTDWIVTVDSSAPLAFSITGTTTSKTITVDTAYAGGTMSVQSFVQRQNITERNKVLTNATADLLIESDGSGTAYLPLGKADVYRVNTATDSSGNDVLVDYSLDNGQRDNYYDVGKLILNSTATAPSARISVDFDYFAHTGTGNYFNAASYNNGGFAYKDIPNYRTKNGELVKLRNVLDFRPRINDAGTGFTGTGAVINELPENTSLIDGNMNFYLPRKDRLVLNDQGDVQYIQGVPSFNPEYPAVNQRSQMNLYDIELGPNSLNSRDTFMSYIENKRYTMRDIGKLEEKIEENRELITLSLLELETSNLEVLDANGNNRTKSGFFVDNFRDHRSQDQISAEFTASNDLEAGELRPSYKETHISLAYDSSSSTDVAIKKNSVMLKYTDEVYINQNLASDTENVNPFNFVNNAGIIILTPERDDWKETEVIRERVLDQVSTFLNSGVEIDQDDDREFDPDDDNGQEARLGSLDRFNNREFSRIDPNWRQWDWGWWGRTGRTGSQGGIGRENATLEAVTEFLRVNNVSLDNRGRRDVRNFLRDFRRIAITSTTREEVVGVETTVQQISIPFMRSRVVAFEARGLRPNTRHFAYFDGVSMADWVRSLSSSAHETLVGNIRANPEFGVRGTGNLDQNPDGPNALITDATGALTGSFFIPGRRGERFNTGNKTFGLLDITEYNLSNATSSAFATYSASGVIERSTVTTTVAQEETVTVRRWDPIAQTFLNDKTHNVFVTSVGIYLATVDDTRDLVCEIRPVVNGYPSATERLRHGISIKKASELVGATSADASVKTTFTFEQPVQLRAETEYAIVLLSQSDNYNVYVATMGNFLVGSTTQKITSQPTLGSFFKSQNGQTWEPSQNQDLTFDLSIADFTPSGLSGEAKFKTNDILPRKLPNNPFYVDSGGTTVRVIHPMHGMLVGDKVLISHLDSASADSDHVRGITDAGIKGLQTIVAKDATGYTFTSSETATSTGFGGGNFWQASEQPQIDLLYTGFNILNPDGTDTTAKIKLTSGQSDAGNETAYVYDTSFTTLVTNGNNYFNARKMIPNSQNKTAQSMTDGDDLRLTLTSDNKYVSPVIDALNTSLHCVTNRIDNQDSAGIAGNQPLTFVAETDPSGGSSIAKYVGKTVTLEDEAVGLKIIVAANKPSVASFDVYYKIAGVDEIISDKSWELATVDNIVPSDDDGITFREYRYTVGGLAGTLDPFVQFKVKIVMKTTNNIFIPKFRDLRAIALSV